MPLTTRDRVTRLIVFDPRKGLLGAPFIRPIGDVVARAPNGKLAPGRSA